MGIGNKDYYVDYMVVLLVCTSLTCQLAFQNGGTHFWLTPLQRVPVVTEQFGSKLEGKMLIAFSIKTTTKA